MEDLNLIGKKIKVVFDDGSRFTSIKTGEVIKQEDLLIWIKNKDEKVEAVGKASIKRIEVIE